MDISIVITGVQPLELSGLANVTLVGGGSEPPVTVAVNNVNALLPIVATLNVRPPNTTPPNTPIPIRVSMRAPLTINGNCPLVGWIYYSRRSFQSAVTFTAADITTITSPSPSCGAGASIPLTANIIARDQAFSLLPIVNAVSTVTLFFDAITNNGTLIHG